MMMLLLMGLLKLELLMLLLLLRLWRVRLHHVSQIGLIQICIDRRWYMRVLNVLRGARLQLLLLLLLILL